MRQTHFSPSSAPVLIYAEQLKSFHATLVPQTWSKPDLLAEGRNVQSSRKYVLRERLGCSRLHLYSLVLTVRGIPGGQRVSCTSTGHGSTSSWWLRRFCRVGFLPQSRNKCKCIDQAACDWHLSPAAGPLYRRSTQLGCTRCLRCQTPTARPCRNPTT